MARDHLREEYFLSLERKRTEFKDFEYEIELIGMDLKITGWELDLRFV